MLRDRSKLHSSNRPSTPDYNIHMLSAIPGPLGKDNETMHIVSSEDLNLNTQISRAVVNNPKELTVALEY